ncbi:murein biosynthesis integral membrane protein MurJ [Patescibacteria group bacterium]|nr:murein biosynthesis integral membrane protein MurJ [Patescibacteria group bacterium]
MDRFIKKTSDFIFSQQKSIFSSAMLISFMIVLTSLSGFLRYRVLAGYFNKDQLDVFFAAFRIPDLIYEILITGAITSTFIPIYLQYKNDHKDLTENISSIINLILLLLIVFIFVVYLFIDRVMPVLTPGYSKEKMDQIIIFSRILLVGQLPFFVLGNFLTGIGQANKTFFLSALAPVLYNLTTIVFTVLFSQKLGLTAPVWGIVLGAFLLFLVQIPLIFKSGFSFEFIIKKTRGLKDFFRLAGPRAFTVVVAQIDATIDLTLATLLGSGAYTVFYFAQHLQLLPVSVIGIAFGQASLPYLSEIYQEKRFDEFAKIITDSLLNLFFMILPMAIFFIFARTPLIRLFFGGEKFDWEATVQTAITLSYFAVALPFHTIYYLLTRCFYSMMDSKTPFYVSASSIAINTILSLTFVFLLHLPIWSLAISFSVAMTINSLVLFFILTKKVHGFNFSLIVAELAKMAFAASISAVVSYGTMKLLDGLIFQTSYTINVFLLLAVTFSLFIGLYLFIGWLIDIKEIYLVGRLLVKAKEYQKKFTELYVQYE